MRSVLVTTLVAAVLSTSSLALAEGGPKKKKAKPKSPTPVMVAAAVEPLPSLPAPEPPPAAPAPAPVAPPAPKDAPIASAPSERPSAGPGFVMVVGSGVSYLGGQIAKEIGVGAVLMTFDLKLGGYVTPHFGIMAGVQAGVGGMFEGCSDTCSNALHYQIPIVAQYAFKDRSQGGYLEGGIGLLSTYLASTDTEKNPDQIPETLRVSAPIDLKLGAGYRIPISAVRDKAATGAFDLRLGADLGEFKKLEYSTVGADIAGNVAAERQALHFTVGLSAGYHFAP